MDPITHWASCQPLIFNFNSHSSILIHTTSSLILMERKSPIIFILRWPADSSRKVEVACYSTCSKSSRSFLIHKTLSSIYHLKERLIKAHYYKCKKNKNLNVRMSWSLPRFPLKRSQNCGYQLDLARFHDEQVHWFATFPNWQIVDSL